MNFPWQTLLFQKKTSKEKQKKRTKKQKNIKNKKKSMTVSLVGIVRLL